MIVTFISQHLGIDLEDDNESYIKKFSKSNWFNAETLFRWKSLKKWENEWKTCWYDFDNSNSIASLMLEPSCKEKYVWRNNP